MINHPYLILERSSQNLKTIGDSKKTILEGIFAEFGVENRNGRIYTEEQYLKHIEYLKKDVANGSLLGELDHPDRYEVSLGNASHRIIELWYEPKTRQVKGRIEILENTPKGQIAKALLDAGVPLSISSRAAGSVNPDKSVEIYQIYTYDLVAKPGFASAQLYSVNESAISAKALEYFTSINESSDSLDKRNISKELGIVSENLSIVSVSESYQFKLRKDNNVYNNNTQKNNNNHMTTLQTTNIDESIDIIEKMKSLDETIKKVEAITEYVNEISKIQETALNWQSDIAKGVNKVAGYVEEISNKSNKHIDLTKKLSEAINYNADIVNNLQEWTGSIARTTNFLAETVDYNAQVTNHMQDWSSSQAKAINNMHEWTSSIAEGVNAVANYTQDMFGRAVSKEDAKKILEYAEALSKKQDTTNMKKKLDESLHATSIPGVKVMKDQKPIKVSKSVDKGKDDSVKFDETSKIIISKGKTVTLKKGSMPKGLSTLDNTTDSTPKVTNSYKPKGNGMDILDDTKGKTIPKEKDQKGVGDYKAKQEMAELPSTKGKHETKQVNESIDKSKEISERCSSLNDRLNQIAESLQKERAVNESILSEFPFTRVLSESDRKRFIDMNQADKQKVANEMTKMPTTDANIIQQIWESAVTKPVSSEPMWLASAPKMYRDLYENSSPVIQNAIAAKADYFVLDTQYKINDFWEKSNLTPNNNITLNEAVVARPTNIIDSTSYDAYMNNICAQMSKYNR